MTKYIIGISMLMVLSILLSAQNSYGQTNLGHGRWEIFTTVNVGHGDYIAGGDGFGYCPPQGQAASYRVEQQLLSAGAAALAKKLATTYNIPLFVGTLALQTLAQIFDQEIRGSGGTGKEVLERLGLVQSYAACQSTNLVVPEGAQIVSIEGRAFEAGADRGDTCPADGNGRYVCRIGWSEWEWQVNGRVVTGLFKNWSGDRSRDGELHVVYEVSPFR